MPPCHSATVPPCHRAAVGEADLHVGSLRPSQDESLAPGREAPYLPDRHDVRGRHPEDLRAPLPQDEIPTEVVRVDDPPGQVPPQQRDRVQGAEEQQQAQPRPRHEQFDDDDLDDDRHREHRREMPPPGPRGQGHRADPGDPPGPPEPGVEKCDGHHRHRQQSSHSAPASSARARDWGPRVVMSSASAGAVSPSTSHVSEQLPDPGADVGGQPQLPGLQRHQAGALRAEGGVDKRGRAGTDVGEGDAGVDERRDAQQRGQVRKPVVAVTVAGARRLRQRPGGVVMTHRADRTTGGAGDLGDSHGTSMNHDVT